MSANNDVLPPIFVGGTGRSGTTIVARLLGRSSQYEMIPVEAKFHASPNGLPAFVAGKASGDDVSKTIRRQWNESNKGQGGLASIVEQDRLRAALKRFLAADGADRVGAARALMDSVLNPVAEAAGKPGWIEMTPRAVFHGRLLHRIFPEMKIVHTVRDGRDVASSLVSMGWQPDFDQALSWWGTRVQRAYTELSKLPASSVFTVNMEDLILHRREETYERLLGFLGWEDERPMHQWFVRTMRPERAHIGRWRADLSSADAAAINKTYRQLLDGLAETGAPLPSQVPT